MRVLVIDDDVDVADMLAGYFRRVRGAAAVSVYTVSNALERLRGGSWDVVVSDLELPDGRGTALLAAARDLLGPGVKLVLSTGCEPDVAAAACADCGADALLLKPYGLSELQVLCDELVGREDG